MKMKKLHPLRPLALAAIGVFLGRGAQADTTIDFNAFPPGGGNNVNIHQTFGDGAGASSEGVTVNGFGTPNINLTWQSTGGVWQYYIDGVWTAGQLDSSDVGDRHEVVFTPNVPQVAAVIKSFNFHPYYNDADLHYTYRISVVNAGGTVLSGPITNHFLSDGVSATHQISLNYTGAIGQTITLRLDRLATASLPGNDAEGGAFDIAVDDIVFAQNPQTEFSVGPEVLTTIPLNNQVSVAPDYFYEATITNKTTSIVTNTIQLRHNGTNLVPTIVSNLGLVTVSYKAVALLPAGSTNKYTLIYGDNGAPAKSYTNEVTYVVAGYVNLQLPAPIVLENFNSTPEESVPAGWTVSNLTDVSLSSAELNLTNLDSASYSNWTVVDVWRFTNSFETYSMGGGTPPDWGADYQRVPSVNPSNVVNGVFLRNLATGRMIFGNSGYRNDPYGQILFLFSPDFNLTGRSNVYLSFHSLWEQNQDSIASVEYSINGGTTWLPALYMLNRSDIFTNLDSSIDSLKTFTNTVIGGFEGIAYWIDGGGNTNGGYYGAFIGVASNLWGTLAPYISARVDDNPVESKRVELIRLPQADNQPTVRLRFAHAGSDSWYWGIDDVGFYALPGFAITSIVRSGNNVLISWPGAANVRLQKTSSLTPTNWQDVAGSLGASSALEPIVGTQGYYRLVRTQ
jgi:hypothetical protein